MARIRTIKPDFWKHEDLSALPEPTHMLAAALLNYSDDYGYFNANVGLIRAECSPLREPSVSIQDSLKLLIEVGYLEMFSGTDGKRYGRVVKFEDHQRVNRPTDSKIKPLCGDPEPSPSTHTQFSEPSSPEGKRNGKEEEREVEGILSSAFAAGDAPEQIENVSRETIAQALLAYRTVAESVNLPKPQGTQRQRKLIATRLRSHGFDDWQTVCEKIRGSPFLQGQAGKDTWPGATLDWICNLTNFEKILEGNYDPPSGNGRIGGSKYDNFLKRGETAGDLDDLQQGPVCAEDGDSAGGEPVSYLRIAG